MSTAQRLLEVGPVGLIPLAWSYTAAVHLGLASVTSLQIAHGVMVVLMLTFLAGGWTAMADGALAAWRVVIAIGIPLTAAGLGGLLWAIGSLQAVSLYGWMVLPAAALVYTGLQPSLPTTVYSGAGALSLLGAVVYAGVSTAPVSPQLLGLALVGVGQTAGIVDAARRGTGALTPNPQ